VPSLVFNVTGADVQFICAVTDKSTVDNAIIDKRVKFLDNLCNFNGTNDLLCSLHCTTLD